MSAFIAIAALLALVSAALIAWPLVSRRRDGEAHGAPVAATVGALLTVIASVGLYVTWSNWDWDPELQADGQTAAGMVASLARRLEREPEDLDGWLTLGRSYAALGQYPLAIRAFQRADRLAQNTNAEALTGLAEALTLENDAELDGRAGRLFEQALELDPDSGKALFFGAAGAQRRGEWALARERFAKLLTLDPPANVRPILEQQLAALDRQIAAGDVALPAQSESASANDNVAAQIRIRVDMDRALAAQVSPSAPLFVLVRAVGAAGPPLAARRLTSQFPQEIVLTSADAMIAGRSFAADEQVEVVARVALSGDPVAKSGDPYGQTVYRVGTDQQLPILINRITP